MIKRPWQSAILLLAVLLSACSSTPKYQQAMDLSVDDYQQNISQQETAKAIILSSQEALHNNPGTADSEYNDNYVQAIIDKASGKVSYHIINVVHYQAPSWRFYELAKYETQEGISEQLTTVIDQQVLECSVFADCTYQETISFEMAADLVQKGAERYQPGENSGLKYLLVAKTGENYHGIMFTQELVAVYNKVQALKK